MASTPNRLSRRTLFAGVGAAGALAAAVRVLPSAQVLPEASAAQPRPKPEKGGGYVLSEHVEQYYRTAQV